MTEQKLNCIYCGKLQPISKLKYISARSSNNSLFDSGVQKSGMVCKKHNL